MLKYSDVRRGGGGGGGGGGYNGKQKFNNFQKEMFKVGLERSDFCTRTSVTIVQKLKNHDYIHF